MTKNASQKAPGAHKFTCMWEGLPVTASWYVYILETGAGFLYTGITTELERRLEEHRGSPTGAKSLRGKGPLKLVYQLAVTDRSEASRLEARIKKLRRDEKLRLIQGDRTLLHKIRDTMP